MNFPLFRSEAIDSRSRAWMGSVRLSTPVPFRYIVIVVLAVLISATLLLTNTGYTRKESVRGKVAPVGGILSVVTASDGVIQSVLVEEGQLVIINQAICEVRATQSTRRFDDTAATIAGGLQQARERLEESISVQREDERTKREEYLSAIRLQEQQIVQIDRQIQFKTSQLRALREEFMSLKELKPSGYVSGIQVRQSEGAVIDAEVSISALEVEKLTLVRAVQSDRHGLESMKASSFEKKRQIDRELADVEQEMVQNEIQQNLRLRAPLDGAITSVLVKQGQHVAAGTTVASMVPKGARLQVELDVPSTSIGFVKQGQKVALRYDAFAYQKYGVQGGSVVSVDSSPMIDSGEQTSIYRAVVSIEGQSLASDVGRASLKPGMEVSADIHLEHRSLLEWLLQPLIGVKRRIRG